MNAEEGRRRRGISTYASQFGMTESDVETHFVDTYGSLFAEEAFQSTGGAAWHEGTLGRKERGLVVIGMLAALGGVEPRLCGHVKWAIANGATANELQTVIALVANYAGFARASIALEIVNEEIDLLAADE